VSHLPQRKENDCLNCGAVLQGLYCHVCGQENYEPKESAWGLITHFFNDITHFDGKFFSSLRLLITRPGFLSLEYMRGRRASYLNPIRMYIFSSAVFFLIFFSFGRSNEESLIKFNESRPTADSVLVAKPKDSLPGKYDPARDTVGLTLGSEHRFNTIAAYDSFQHTLPDSLRDGWVKQYLARKDISMREKYGDNKRVLISTFQDKFTHSLPQMFFLSLPIIALLLKALYFRRKQYFYTNHAIFVIHYYIVSFIMLLFNMMLGRLNDITDAGLFVVLQALLWGGMYLYLYKAMRHFYQQGRAKTVLKFFLFNLASTFIIALLAFIFVLISFYKM
jgi:Protein of unknown function (DUF3667)